MAIILVAVVAVLAAIAAYLILKYTDVGCYFTSDVGPAVGILFLVLVLGIGLCATINQETVVSVEEYVVSVNYADVEHTTKGGNKYTVSVQFDDGTQKQLDVSAEEYAIAANSDSVKVKVSRIDNSTMPDKTVYNILTK